MIKGIADATKIATAIVLAGTIIAFAIYMRPVPNRFEFRMAADGQIQRFDTATGETMFCPEDAPCFGYDRNGRPVGNQTVGQENSTDAPAGFTDLGPIENNGEAAVDHNSSRRQDAPPVPPGFVTENEAQQK